MSNFSSIKEGYVYIDQNKLRYLITKYSPEEIADIIVKDIRKYNLPPPIRYLSDDEAYYDFKKLCELNTEDLLIDSPLDLKFCYKYPVTNKFIKKNDRGLRFSNHFFKEYRYKSRGKGCKSLFQLWYNDERLKKIISKFRTLKIDKISRKELLGMMTLSTHIPSQFKPSVAKYIYDHYSGNGSVLDFSAGWGDRLCGALSSPKVKRYIGIDPNKALYNKYFELHRASKAYTHIEIFNKPAENVEFPRNIDLVFTSPPYFSKEVYCTDPSQSYCKYPNFEDWMLDFLFETIYRSWESLKKGGYLIINISDILDHKKVYKICDEMNKFIEDFIDSRFIEGLGMQITKRPNIYKKTNNKLVEPIWIWKKA